jgi:predicted MFS family arabinose efflux permease
VGRDDLPNAIALNSLAFNGARLIGPAVGGFVLAAYGEATVFLINGVTYFAVLAGLWVMHVDPPPPARRVGGWLGEIRKGLSWVVRNRSARGLLVLTVVSSFFGFPYSILLPVFARDVLEVGSRGLGLMMGATGLGAMCGALGIAARKGLSRPGRLVAMAMIVLGGSLVLFSFSRSFALSMVLLFCTGLAMLVQLASSNTALQLMAPADLRGRIVSLYMLAFMGVAPLGSLLAGAVAREIGTPAAVRIGACVCVVTGAWYVVVLPRIRRGNRQAAST